MSSTEAQASPASGGDPAAGAGDSRPHAWYRIWGEVAGAWAISLAWPVYSNIASGPEALTSYGLRRLDLLVLIVVVSLLGPLVITLWELVIRRLFGEPARRGVHGLVIGSLLALVVWQWLVDRESATLIRTLLPLALALLVAWSYLRTELIRNFALMLSFATIVVIGVFAFDYPVKEEVLPHEAKASTPAVDAETPVVIVVFDELPLAALQKPDGRIDPRFPTFAMLARKANWYPDTVAISDQTLYALPAILTGTDPEPRGSQEPPAPGVANYPDSICRIAGEGGYDLHAYEPITDLCERSWGLGTRLTATLRRALGTDAPDQEQLLPGDLQRKIGRAINAPFEQPPTEIGKGRKEAFRDFTENLPARKRSLSVLHSILPHVYWMYLPDGRTYPTFRAVGETQLTSPASDGEIARDAQQMMLQLEFTDRELGRLVRKMKSDGTWDEALFVVTADHGAAFQNGGSRRMVNVVNDGWILPVPLFIKYPGQQHGQVIPGTIDGRDIAPTVLGQLGLDPPEGMVGRDLSGRSRQPTKSTATVLSTFDGKIRMDLESMRRNRRQASQAMHQMLGESLYAPGGHADLLGRKPAGLKRITAAPVDASLYENVDTSSDELPAYYQAQLEIPEGTDPGPVAVTLNGRIVATARPWPALGSWYTGVVLPPEEFRDGANEIAVYEIDSGR